MFLAPVTFATVSRNNLHSPCDDVILKRSHVENIYVFSVSSKRHDHCVLQSSCFHLFKNWGYCSLICQIQSLERSVIAVMRTQGDMWFWLALNEEIIITSRV